MSLRIRARCQHSPHARTRSAPGGPTLWLGERIGHARSERTAASIFPFAAIVVFDVADLHGKHVVELPAVAALRAHRRNEDTTNAPDDPIVRREKDAYMLRALLREDQTAAA